MGSPACTQPCLAALSPAAGEMGIHVGAGTGYYSAIPAKLVGSEGRIAAYEIEPALAEQAKRNLASLSQVGVESRSGATGPLPQADFIYVNAGATHPAEPWLDALKAGGRLLFPLTPSEGVGGMLLLRKVTEDTFEARLVCAAMFIPCVGVRDDGVASALSEAFRSTSIWAAASFRRRSSPDNSCCFAAETWWLSTSPL